jgi:hypothetical protein
VNNWTVKDWRLEHSGPAGETLWTDKKYGDFKLIADVRGSAAILLGEVTMTPQRAEPSTEEAKAKLKEQGGWVRYVITVQRGRYTVELDGQVVVKEQPVGEKPVPGSIGLKPDQGTVQFTNLHIKELD